MRNLLRGCNKSRRSDLFFLWVAVLGYEITGVPGKHYVVYFFARTLGHRYRFVDVNKMIGNRFTSGFAAFFSFINCVEKIAPLGISKQFLQFSCQPVFYAILFVSSIFKCAA